MIVPPHFGLTLYQYSSLVGSFGLYGITIMQIYLYLLDYQRHDDAIVKLFIVYLWSVETAQLVINVRGGVVLVTEYWRRWSALSGEFIWGRFLTILCVAPIHLYIAAHIYPNVKTKLKVPHAKTAMIVLGAIGFSLPIAGYIVILVYFSRGPFDAHTAHVIQGLSKAIWAVIAAESLAITCTLLVTYHRAQRPLDGLVSNNTWMDRLVVIGLNGGILTSALNLVAVIAMNVSADLEVFSGTAMLLGPLYVNMLLGHLSSRAPLPHVQSDLITTIRFKPGESTRSTTTATRITDISNTTVASANCDFDAEAANDTETKA